jgi:hypothetical protein
MVIRNCPNIQRFTLAGDVSEDEGRRKHLFPGEISLSPEKPCSWSEDRSLDYYIEKLISSELRMRGISLENTQI